MFLGQTVAARQREPATTPITKMTGRQGDMSILAVSNVRPSDWPRLTVAADGYGDRSSFGTKNLDLAASQAVVYSIEPEVST